MSEAKHRVAALRRDTLLKEYDVCARRADFNTNLVWTWATLLVSVNGAALGLMIRRPDKVSSLDAYLGAVFVGLAASLIIWWWQAASSRWHETIRIFYERMKDIEAECDMWANRYVDIHDSAAFNGDPLQDRLRARTGRALQGEPNVGVSLKAMRLGLSIAVPAAWVTVACVHALQVVAGGGLCLSWEPRCQAFAAVDWLHGVLLSCVLLVLLVATWLGMQWVERRPLSGHRARPTRRE